jgi:RsiW-degrading membrane proteinase PrsW (M82 family)
LYLAFALALIPLAFSLLQSDEGEFERRLERTAEALDESPEALRRLNNLQQEKGRELTLTEVVGVLPDGRVQGSHLSVHTWTHWLYALLSCSAMLGAVWLMFPHGQAVPLQLLAVTLITATVGVLSLLMFQWMAALTQGVNLIGRNIIIVALFYVVKFVGYSYQAASDPSNGFLLSLLGYTFGVGLCEELTKAMPVFMHFRGRGEMSWRGACMWGLVSGIGFGVAEGIMYSSDYYNGVSTGGIYVVRFVSCVALHAVWSGAAAISIYNNQAHVEAQWDWGDFLAVCLKVLAVPMLLHGLYDTLLKRDMSGLALLIAFASFA